MSLEGIDELHGALATLEARLLASETPDPDEILAGSLGACLLSVLLFEAVSERIARDGLPRPLCVMAGSNGVYPYFDAPVAGFPDEARNAADAEEEEAEISTAIPAPRYSSLLLTGVPRGTKRAVLVLQETEAETAARFANLRDQSHIETEAETGPQQPQLPADPTESTAPAEPALPDPEIAELSDSPLLAKKQPGKAWDFRDMLSSRDPDSPAAEREEIDWDDWSDPPSPPVGEALESDPIDWDKPFEAPPLLGAEPPAFAAPSFEPEPVDWDEVPEAVEPAVGFTPPEPADWADAELPQAEQPAPEPESIDWSDAPEAAPAPDVEPQAFEPAAVEAEPADWPEAPLPLAEGEAQEPGSIDWDEPSEPPEPVAGFTAFEPVDWPEPPLPPTAEELQAHEAAPIDWGAPSEAPPRGFEMPAEEAEAVDWPEHLPKPGFSLLEPVLAAPVSISYEPLAPLELTETIPEPEPEPIAVDPRDLPIPDWPLGLGWLEDQEEAAAEPLRPSLWDRLRAWLGR